MKQIIDREGDFVFIFPLKNEVAMELLNRLSPADRTKLLDKKIGLSLEKMH